jgi:methionine sulfoxide reductase heme-binding subunit
MQPMMQSLKKHWLLLVTHVGALLPLALLVGGYFTNQLGVNPIQEITFRTGKFALVLLVLSLACTPVNTVFGFKRVLPLRRPLGLYAFLYVCLHLLTFVGLDYGFAPGLIRQEIVEKRYILVGFAAFLLLLPLAVTSTRGWMRRLGKNWKRLHRLVYAAALLAVLHYVWVVKSDIREPLIYGGVILLLLLLRLPQVRRGITTWRQRRRGRSRPIAPTRMTEER